MKLDKKGLEAAQGAFLYGLHLCGVHKDQRPVEIVPAIIRAYLQATSEWKPIETIPDSFKDGTEFLAYDAVCGKMDVCCNYDGLGVYPVQFDGERGADLDEFGYHTDDITHWMPLPPPPTDKGA